MEDLAPLTLAGVTIGKVQQSLPFAHKDALYVTIALHDAPLPDEIATICAYAMRGRPNHRVGGLAAADIKSTDGFT